MITCLLLSGGESRRFGSPKATADIAGTPNIVQLQERLISTRINEIIVVTGYHHTEIDPLILNHKKVRSVHNKDHNLGQSSSVKAGIRQADSSTEGFMIYPVDFPLIKVQTINLIIDNFCEMPDKILIPTYDRKKGHPPILPSHFKIDILDLPADVGLNSLQHKYGYREVQTQDPAVLASFNTPEELNIIVRDLL